MEAVVVSVMTVVAVPMAVPEAMVMMMAEPISPVSRIEIVRGIGIVIIRAIGAIPNPTAPYTAVAVVSASAGDLLDITLELNVIAPLDCGHRCGYGGFTG